MKNTIRTIIASSFIPIVIISASVAFAAKEESKSVSEEISELKKGQEVIQKDLEEIKKLLVSRPMLPAPPLPIEKSDAIVPLGGIMPMGKKDAPVTLIEFTDYQCPYCNRHALQTLPLLIKDYIDTGKARYTIRDFPLEQIHPNAVKAAEAARCAGDENKYWEMHGKLFVNQKQLQPEKLLEYAKAIGLNEDDFKACLDKGKYTVAVKKDIEEGNKLGVRGTPTVMLGMSDNDQLKNTVIMRGALPYNTFKTEIDKLLAPPGAEKK